jgi:glutathione synthase
MIESSTACKCPSVTYQLAGSKKVQQDLAMPGVVERFVGKQDGAALRQLFAGKLFLHGYIARSGGTISMAAGWGCTAAAVSW